MTSAEEAAEAAGFDTREPKAVVRSHLDRTFDDVCETFGPERLFSETQKVKLAALRAAIDLVSDDPAPEKVPASAAVYAAAEPSATVRLAFPFTLDGTDVSSIAFRPPVYADVIAVNEGKMTEMQLHSLMTGVPLDALQSLRWPDLEMVTVIARHLAPSFQRGA